MATDHLVLEVGKYYLLEWVMDMEIIDDTQYVHVLEEKPDFMWKGRLGYRVKKLVFMRDKSVLRCNSIIDTYSTNTWGIRKEISKKEFETVWSRELL